MKKRKTVKKDVQVGLEDERFAHLKSDPKFSGLSNKEKKVVIEKRFAAALTDAKFSSRAPVDKRGRKMKKTTGNDLLDLYEVEEESEDDRPMKKARKSKEESVEVKAKPTKLDLARGEGNISSSDESDSESDWELPDDVQQNMNIANLDHDAEKVEWASRRLAACNLDWNLIKAEDILILVNSFKPPGGKIESVSIYLSDFGKERLEEENKYGPRLKIKKPIEDIQEGDELEPETRAAVRKYQIDLLKYYYAVIECDTEATATAIYEQCDGFQFETSGLKMDLRFIPDDMEFEENRLKERMTESDLNLDKYKSKEKILCSVARTDGKLAWDENDEERTRRFMDAFNEEDEGTGLIADSDSDDEEAAERRKKILRALLNEEDKDDELEVEWSDSEHPMKKEDKNIEDVEGIKEDDDSDDSDIEKALAKRDDDHSSEDERVEAKDESIEDVENTTKKKNKYTAYLEKRKQKQKERKQKRKEAKEVEKEELEEVGKEAKLRQQNTKAKKAAQKSNDEIVEKVVADDRFGALFTDSAFAIEQSAKEFKGSKLIEKQASIKKQNKSVQNTCDDLLSKLKAKANKWEQKKQKKKYV